jgi:hypothetical protein
MPSLSKYLQRRRKTFAPTFGTTPKEGSTVRKLTSKKNKVEDFGKGI